MIGDRWGMTDSEMSRSYPCDNFVVSPALEAWRGVRVEAPAEAVWPWVAQVRLAPYSYDWIDNLGRRSPRELVGLPEPQVGESFTTAGGRKVGRIVSVDPGRQLTGTIMGAFMSYVLVPQQRNATRLLLKVVMQTTRWAAVGLSVGELIMARRQLLNLRQLAERHQYQGTAQGNDGQPRTHRHDHTGRPQRRLVRPGLPDARDGDTVVAGVIGNRSASVVGVSNLSPWPGRLQHCRPGARMAERLTSLRVQRLHRFVGEHDDAGGGRRAVEEPQPSRPVQLPEQPLAGAEHERVQEQAVSVDEVPTRRWRGRSRGVHRLAVRFPLAPHAQPAARTTAHCMITRDEGGATWSCAPCTAATY
jgi:hypothetical protein